jgi:DNA-binding response OmpR family regulator
MKSSSAIIVLLADRKQTQTAKALKAPGYRVVTTYTPDHAVAVCVNNPVDIVILDQEHFIQTEGWSVAKSIKMIRQKICVILAVRGKIIGNYLPDGVDVIVPDHDVAALLAAVKHLLKGY